MENASKALLIAAGVLIVILLIAFGMSIFNSTGDTSVDAQAVGTEIKGSTSQATVSAMLSITKMNPDDFYKYLKSEYEGVKPGKI